MASGILGQADLAVADTAVYTVPTSPATVATVNINICNRTAAAVTVNVALAATATPALTEYIEFGVSIPANGVLERTGVVVGSGFNVVVTPAAVGLSCTVSGFEE